MLLRPLVSTVIYKNTGIGQDKFRFSLNIEFLKNGRKLRLSHQNSKKACNFSIKKTKKNIFTFS